MLWRRPHVNEGATDTTTTASDTTVVVQMVHSEETRAWLEEAARLFKKVHPEIVLQFTSMGSIESIEAIAERRIDPLVWSPSDSSDLALLKARMRSSALARAAALKATALTVDDTARANALLAEDSSQNVFSSESGGAPQPMLLSPLVWLGWESQTQGLRSLQAERVPHQRHLLSWSVVYELLTGELGWSSPPDGMASHAMEPLRVGYADPKQASSGIQSLYLLTLEFFASSRPPRVNQLNNPRYLKLVRDVDSEAISSGLSSDRLLEDMLRYGPSKFDIILTYESMALHAIRTFPENRFGRLKIFYPTYTVWNDHPVVQMATKPWNEEETAAARAWISFLRGKEMQAKALEFGFRPGDPNIPLNRDPNGNGPLDKLIQAGMRLDLPTAAVTDEQLLPALLDLWIQETSNGDTLQVAGPWSGPSLEPLRRPVPSSPE